MNNLLFKCSKICKSFYQGEATIQVLKDIDFSLEKSSSVAITGPSGSGKTTPVSYTHLTLPTILRV